MGGSYWLFLLVGGASLLSVVLGSSCRDGHPGENGQPGRDGLPGAKGEKGEPAVGKHGTMDFHTLRRLKGDIGSRGPQGPIGPKGFSGNLGPLGVAGSPGSQGPQGVLIGEVVEVIQSHSAFSVIRNDITYPSLKQVVKFDIAVVNDPPEFNLRTGLFTCNTPGFYYFTFHSFTKVSMCLAICSDTLREKLGFCDFSRNTEQVLSGGVVLELRKGQKVWLESFKDLQSDGELKNRLPKQIIFNGFLLF